MSIRIGIAGYGNLGRGVESAIQDQPDMRLVGIFTRRNASEMESVTGTQIFAWDALGDHVANIDVMIACGGSKQDLPVQVPELASLYNTVDSFDNHHHIPEYFAAVDAAARAASKVSVISTGWDPGLFSLNRLLGEAVLPAGDTYTFWGRGVSQGHSDALRRVPGVATGVQYTVPSEEAMAAVRAGLAPNLTTRQMHSRECFVVLEPGADAESVKQAIVTMPDYFEPYDTSVTFVSVEEFTREHVSMPHGGFVLRSGTTGQRHHQLTEFALKLDNNPGFTSSVLTAYARAASRLANDGLFGAKTVYDIAPGLLSPKSPEQLRAELL